MDGANHGADEIKHENHHAFSSSDPQKPPHDSRRQQKIDTPLGCKIAGARAAGQQLVEL